MVQIDATAACVLGLLLLGPAPGLAPAAADGAMTGWQIYETAGRSLGRFWNVTRSQIYLELGRLADAGLVEAGGVTGRRVPGVRTALPTRVSAPSRVGWNTSRAPSKSS